MQDHVVLAPSTGLLTQVLQKISNTKKTSPTFCCALLASKELIQHACKLCRDPSSVPTDGSIWQHIGCVVHQFVDLLHIQVQSKHILGIQMWLQMYYYDIINHPRQSDNSIPKWKLKVNLFTTRYKTQLPRFVSPYRILRHGIMMCQPSLGNSKDCTRMLTLCQAFYLRYYFTLLVYCVRKHHSDDIIVYCDQTYCFSHIQASYIRHWESFICQNVKWYSGRVACTITVVHCTFTKALYDHKWKAFEVTVQLGTFNTIYSIALTDSRIPSALEVCKEAERTYTYYLLGWNQPVV